MPRPIKKRTAKSYLRDVEALNRLRMAIRIDPGLDVEQADRAIVHIDRLVGSLLILIEEREKTEEEIDEATE